MVVYNGEVYENITAGGLPKEGGPKTYFFKPLKGRVPRSEYLKIISSEKIDPAEFFSAIDDPVQRDIRKLFVEHLLAYRKTHPRLASASLKDAPEIITPEFTGSVRSALDKRVRDGILSGYNYEPAYDSLTLTYSSDEIPFQLHPFMDATTVDFVIRTHLHAKNYAKNALKDYKQRLHNGDVLIINTKKETPFHDFFERDALLEEFLIISDDGLTREQKIEKFTKGLKRVKPGGKPDNRQKQPVFKSRRSGKTRAATSSGSVSELLDRNGVIVPPSKRIAFLRAPDYIVRQYIEGDIFKEESYEIGQLRNPAGIFSIYHQNDYTIEITTAGWEEAFVETLAGVMADESVSIVYLKTHGDNNALLTEIYDMGAVDLTRDEETYREARKKLSALRRRVEILRGKYGNDSISVYLKMRSVLSEKDRTHLNQHIARIPEQLRHLLKEQKRLGVIAVTGEFFQKIPGKKALFILRACHGGSLADKIKARDILACDPRCFTSEYMFVQSDLRKIAPYIFKQMQPGPLKVTKEAMRNYNIITSFKNPPLLRPGVDSRIEEGIIDHCYPQKDRLLSIKLWGPADQAVSPSPHVELADGDRIVFNAPMDNSIPARDVVTITCRAHAEEAAKLEPKWISDREIALPWKGKVYRDWKDSDFYANGTPQVDYDTIVVKHTQAKSTFSHVQLSGNPDGVARKYCRIKECWRNPCLITYNGNRPKSDFVFMLPCIKKEEQTEPVQVSVTGGDQMKHIMTIPVVDDFMPFQALHLDIDGTRVIDHNKTSEEHHKHREYPNPVPILSLAGGGYDSFAAFGNHTAYVRQTHYRRPKNQTVKELFYDGSVIYKSYDHQVHDIRLFGDHISYYLVHRKGTQEDFKLIHDGKTYDPEVAGRSHMLSSTSMIGVNKKDEVFFDGRILGKKARLGYGMFEHYSHSRYGYSEVSLFKSNVAFTDENNHLRALIASRSNELLDLGEGTEMYLFGDHCVFSRRTEFKIDSGGTGHEGVFNYWSIVYDGKNMGPGVQPHLFGDHLVFKTSCNPITRKGPLYTMSYEELEASNKPKFTSHERYLFFDGKYYDVGEKLNLPKNSNNWYEFKHPRVFNGHIAFILTIDNGRKEEDHMIHDWKDLGQCISQIPVLSGDHIVFTRKVGRREHVVYDGQDLGEGREPVICCGHIAFKRYTGTIYYDGKEYPDKSSILANMYACYRYYLENFVPVSGYGTVDFKKQKKEAGR